MLLRLVIVFMLLATTAHAAPKSKTEKKPVYNPTCLEFAQQAKRIAFARDSLIPKQRLLREAEDSTIRYAVKDTDFFVHRLMHDMIETVYSKRSMTPNELGWEHYFLCENIFKAAGK
jgi:hypothetical protein